MGIVAVVAAFVWGALTGHVQAFAFDDSSHLGGIVWQVDVCHYVAVQETTPVFVSGINAGCER